MGKKALPYEPNKKVESNTKVVNNVENNIVKKLEVVASIDNPSPKQNSDIVLTTAKVTSNEKPVEGCYSKNIKPL